MTNNFRRGIAVVALGVAVAAPPLAAPAQTKAAKQEPAKTWAEYQERYAFTCMGPLEKLAEPEVIKTPTRSLRIEGYRVQEMDQDKDNRAVLGIISTIKDAVPATLYNLEQFVAKWKKAGAQAVIVGGDVGDGENATKKVLAILAAPGWPVYVVMGNNDSRGSFNRAIRSLTKSKFPNIINLNMARRIDGDDFDIVSLPGYYDKRFTASGASCVYKKDDVASIDDLMQEKTNDPVIFVSHGPPRDKGKNGIDVAVEAGNVGDPDITEVIVGNKIRFGVFGHIIEAGGAATDLNGKSIPQGKWASRLYLNPGSASSFPWGMNDGSTNAGRAALLEFKGKKARYTMYKIDSKQHDEVDADRYEEMFEYLEDL